jgi:hypothetical protein
VSYSYTDAELAKELREIAERGHTVRGKPDAAWFMRQAADALERARGPNGEHFAGPGTLAAALEPNAPYLRAALPTKYHHFFDTVLMPLARMGCESLRPNASPSATHSLPKEGP